jgi:hypothetical protein
MMWSRSPDLFLVQVRNLCVIMFAPRCAGYSTDIGVQWQAEQWQQNWQIVLTECA